MGANEIKVQCPLCGFQATIEFQMNILGNKIGGSATVSSCGCDVEVCGECRRKTNLSRLRRNAKDTIRRWFFLCFGGHYDNATREEAEPQMEIVETGQTGGGVALAVTQPGTHETAPTQTEARGAQLGAREITPRQTAVPEPMESVETGREVPEAPGARETAPMQTPVEETAASLPSAGNKRVRTAFASRTTVVGLASAGGPGTKRAKRSSGCHTSVDEANLKMAEDSVPGLVAIVKSTARKTIEQALKGICERLDDIEERLASQPFQGNSTVVNAPPSMSVDHTWDRDQQNFNFFKGFGHLVKAATPEGERKLRRFKESGVAVEVAVAGKIVGSDFVITFDTKRVEREEGWMLMATGMHHIAFAAAGGLDHRADDVFSAEDTGGAQQLLVNEQQTTVEEDEVVVVAFGDDGSVVFMSRKAVWDQKKQKLVMGLRMGEIEEMEDGRKKAWCYTKAGFFDSGLAMEAIVDRDSAMRAAEEDWRNGATLRMAMIEEEVAEARKQRKQLMAELQKGAEERREMQKQLSKKRVDEADASELRRMVQGLVASPKEQQLEDEQTRLAMLELELCREKRALAQRYKRNVAGREEVERVQELGRSQLEEELLAEKERMREHMQKESARAEKFEVLLAALRATTTEEIATLNEEIAKLTEEGVREHETRCGLSDKAQALENELEGLRSEREDASTREEVLVAENEELVHRNEALTMEKEELTIRTTELLANLREVEEQLAMAADSVKINTFTMPPQAPAPDVVAEILAATPQERRRALGEDIIRISLKISANVEAAVAALLGPEMPPVDVGLPS